MSQASLPLFWRDPRVIYLLIGWCAAVLIVVVLVSVGLYPHFGSASVPLSSAGVRDGDDYKGTMIVVPRVGEHCWQLGFDNHNGALRDDGTIDCNSAVPQTLTDGAAMRYERMKSLQNAFRSR